MIPRFFALSRHGRIHGIFLFNSIAILGSTSFISYLVANVSWIGTTLKNFHPKENDDNDDKDNDDESLLTCVKHDGN